MTTDAPTLAGFDLGAVPTRPAVTARPCAVCGAPAMPRADVCTRCDPADAPSLFDVEPEPPLDDHRDELADAARATVRTIADELDARYPATPSTPPAPTGRLF